MYNPMIASFLIIYDNDKLAKLGIYLELGKLVVKLSHSAIFTAIERSMEFAGGNSFTMLVGNQNNPSRTSVC